MCCLTLSSAVTAAPQWNAAVVPGLCGVHSRTRTEMCFHGSVRGDVLFARQRGSDWGLGPSLEVGSVNFGDLRLSGGASLLLPVSAFPLVLSAGPLVVRDGATRYGVAGRAFWGFREYNHSGSYSAASGLLLGWDQQIGSNSERVWSLSLQLDAMWLALPALLAYNWARGPSD